MNCQLPFRQRHGFTLVEIMVAVMIFSMVIAAIYATWALIMRASEVGQKHCRPSPTPARGAARHWRCIDGRGIVSGLAKYYWFRLANGAEPYLSFVARLPDTFPRHNKICRVRRRPRRQWRAALRFRWRRARREKDLILRQNRILMELDADETQYPLVLAKNVKLFTIEWWGTNEMNQAQWNTDWDDNQTNTIRRWCASIW